MLHAVFDQFETSFMSLDPKRLLNGFFPIHIIKIMRAEIREEIERIKPLDSTEQSAITDVLASTSDDRLVFREHFKNNRSTISVSHNGPI